MYFLYSIDSNLSTSILRELCEEWADPGVSAAGLPANIVSKVDDWLSVRIDEATPWLNPAFEYTQFANSGLKGFGGLG